MDVSIGYFPMGQLQHWSKLLAQVITDIDELCAILDIERRQLPNHEMLNNFPLRVPRSFVDRMEKNNPNDPLLLQILPRAKELLDVVGFNKNPLQEDKANPARGLLHKYHGRVLLLLSGGCAINCRYCFRRYFPYEKNTPGIEGWESVFDYIRRDNSIEEIILSGGDPLIVKDNVLQQLTKKLETVSHINRLRIHTRLPVVIPERITKALITCLRETRLQAVIVLHCNHPREIDARVIGAIHKLRHDNIVLLNQSVLLRHINDNVSVLSELSKRLFMCGVLPYYLHLLDPVQGSAHFYVSEERAKAVVWQLSQQLPGYLIPKLVREMPGAPAKVVIPVTENFVF